MGLRFEHAFVVKSPADRVWAYLIDPYRVAPALPGATITEKKDDQTYGGAITVKVGPVSAKYKGTLRFENVDAAARTAEMVAKGQDVSGRGGADMRMQSRLAERTPGETEVTVVSDVNVTGILAQMGRGLIQDVSNQMFQRFTEAVRAELERPEAEAVRAAPPSADGAASAASVTAAAGAAATPASAPVLATPAGAAATAAAAAVPPANANVAVAVAAPRPPSVASPPIEVFSFGGKILARAAGRTMRKPLFWVVAAAVAAVLYRWFSR